MIYMLWMNACLKNVLYKKVLQIILNFIGKDEKHYNRLWDNLPQLKNTFQYVYSCVCPDVYCSTERRGFDLESTFQLVLKTYKHKSKLEHVGKNSQNYAVEIQTSFKQN